MNVLPCPLCGYDAPGVTTCGHCRLSANEPSLAGARSGPVSGSLAGLRAMPKGLGILLSTPGLKRFLVPPLALTLLGFLLLIYWFWGLVGALFDAALLGDASSLDWDAGWVRTVAVWLLESKALLLTAGLGRLFFFALASWFLVSWTFSILYEAVAGPFLDEIQGRLEARWFGSNPRDALQRPTGIPVRRCVKLSLIAGSVPLAALLLWWLGGLGFWLALASAPLAFGIAAAVDRDYGTWLGWVLRVESRTLWISFQAAALSGIVLLLFLWLKLIPVVGPPLFVVLAGFVTSISLLDIPFSRRQWSLRQRARFMGRNIAAMVSFGLVAGLVFMIPVLGPVLMVPAASIGGLWLLCDLDKNPLRPAGQRMGEDAARAKLA